jgi:hypothetical protein
MIELNRYPQDNPFELSMCQNQIKAAYDMKQKGKSWAEMTEMCRNYESADLCNFYVIYGLNSIEYYEQKHLENLLALSRSSRYSNNGGGQTVYNANECIGAIVNGQCHGSILLNRAYHPTCHGQMINGTCTGPMF